MNYKKKVYDNYNLHLISTDRFKNITVCFRFTKNFKKEDMPFFNLLALILTYSSKKYNTKNKMAIRFEELYLSDIEMRRFNISSLENFEIRINFINPKYTEESIYSKVFRMLEELLFNPFVKDGKFDQYTFNLLKQNSINDLKLIKDNASKYALLKYYENMFKGNSYSYTALKELDDLNNLTSKNLYDFYKRLFNSYKINVLVLGDFDEEKIIMNVEDVMKAFIKSDEALNNLFLDNKPTHKTKEIIEKSSHNQSSLFMGYIFKKLTMYERHYVLPVYNMILGSMNNSVLFVRVREDASLCYHIGSFTHKYASSLTIEAGINEKNYNVAVRTINSCVKSMEKPSTIKPLLTNAISTINLSLNDYYENINKIIDNYFFSEFESIDNIDERRKLFSKVSVEDINKLNKKISLSTIYLLKGVNNEKN